MNAVIPRTVHVADASRWYTSDTPSISVSLSLSLSLTHTHTHTHTHTNAIVI